MKYVKLFTGDGDSWTVPFEEEPRLDAGVEAYLTTGKDRLLAFTLVEGDQLRILASEIVSWATSTPEGRQRYVEMERDSGEEMKGIRQSLGIWDD